MNKSGFTLLEVIIGVALLAALGILLTTTVRESLKDKTRVERADEVIHSIRGGLGKMVGDLNQALLANNGLQGQNTSYFTGLKGDDDEIHFSTFSHYHYVQDEHDTDQVFVGYSLKKNDKGFYDLMRRESLRLGDKLEEGGTSFLLVDNVKELKIEYYDSGKTEWVKAWDTSQISSLGKLPMAVKITMTVVELKNLDSEEVVKEYTMTTTARLDLYKNEINF